jgi:Lon protease-like protein
MSTATIDVTTPRPITRKTGVAIFPLSAVLFPHGVVPLQIFEARYLDMVAHCLKHDVGFVVAGIREGHEVVRVKGEALPDIYRVGCYARITHWDGMPGQKLLIRIQGQARVHIDNLHEQSNRLLVGDIEEISESPDMALPREYAALADVLAALLQHPSLAKLDIPHDAASVAQVTSLLAQYLPLTEAKKQRLLSDYDIAARLPFLKRELETLSGGPV